MNGFFDDNRKALSNFEKVSQSVGARADYVQGGGGNTSAKLTDGLMAIKASGYCLKDVRADAGYAVLDYVALRDFYLNSEPDRFDDVEAAGSGRAKALTRAIEGLPALRPSVEAGFHSLLDTYVAHSHSVYANLAACSRECTDIVAEALKDADYTWGFVPYVNPGARLTFAIRDELRRVERETGRRPAVIFMENHGLIAHHDDPDECLRIHTDVNERVARAFGIRAGDFPAVSVTETENGLVRAVSPFLAEEIRTGAYDESFFLDTPLYPDQQVFLTGSFKMTDQAPQEGMCSLNPETGEAVFNMPAQKAQVIAETLTAVVFIVKTVRDSGRTLCTMGEAAQSFIANWESEKYRKSLAGK